ncbi:MAG: HEAT repeat domain-containing protein [Candidatus Methylacidiphilales bacterium]|nr:HEAT repeat domain-containing protein [Candidatus Methylacidiphilales bacterium]
MLRCARIRVSRDGHPPIFPFQPMTARFPSLATRILHLAPPRLALMLCCLAAAVSVLMPGTARAQWEVSLPGRYPVPQFLRDSSQLPLRDAAYKGRSYFFYFGSKEGQIFHAEIHILANGRESAAKFLAMKHSIAIPELKEVPPEASSMGDDCSVRGSNPAKPAAVLFREGRVIFFLTGQNAMAEGIRLHRVWWADSGAGIVAQLTEIEPRLRLVPLYEGGVPPIVENEDVDGGQATYSASTHDSHAVHTIAPAVPGLLKLLTSSDPTERVYAVVRLRKLGDAAMASKLIPLLAVQERQGVRIQVLRTLGEWKAVEALPAILEILDAPPGMGRRTDIGSDRALKSEAVAAVARISNIAASARLRDLIRASSQDAEFRQLCVKALVSIEGKPAIVKAKPETKKPAEETSVATKKKKKTSDKQTRVLRTEE